MLRRMRDEACVYGSTSIDFAEARHGFASTPRASVQRGGQQQDAHDATQAASPPGVPSHCRIHVDDHAVVHRVHSVHEDRIAAEHAERMQAFDAREPR